MQVSIIEHRKVGAYALVQSQICKKNKQKKKDKTILVEFLFNAIRKHNKRLFWNSTLTSV